MRCSFIQPVQCCGARGGGSRGRAVAGHAPSGGRGDPAQYTNLPPHAAAAATGRPVQDVVGVVEAFARSLAPQRSSEQRCVSGYQERRRIPLITDAVRSDLDRGLEPRCEPSTTRTRRIHDPKAVHALRPHRSGQGPAGPVRAASSARSPPAASRPSGPANTAPGPALAVHTGALPALPRDRLGAVDAGARRRPRGLAQHLSLLERPARGPTARPPCPADGLIGQAGWYLGDLSVPVGPDTWRSALRSCETAISAADALSGRRTRRLRALPPLGPSCPGRPRHGVLLS